MPALNLNGCTRQLLMVNTLGLGGRFLGQALLTDKPVATLPVGLLGKPDGAIPTRFVDIPKKGLHQISPHATPV